MPKRTFLSHRKRREAYHHNTAPRLEGVVKNAGVKPIRKKEKKGALTKQQQQEVQRYAEEQLEAWE